MVEVKGVRKYLNLLQKYRNFKSVKIYFKIQGSVGLTTRHSALMQLEKISIRGEIFLFF